MVRRQKTRALTMFDFPEALGPKSPTVFRTARSFQCMTLWESSRARAVLMFAARKSIFIRSRIEKKFSNSIFSIILQAIL